MSRALRYLLNHHRALGCLLRQVAVPLDNNIAEAALRRGALGRFNFIFFGNEKAGYDCAALYTLVASCEKHGIYINSMPTIGSQKLVASKNAGAQSMQKPTPC